MTRRGAKMRAACLGLALLACRSSSGPELLEISPDRAANAAVGNLEVLLRGLHAASGFIPSATGLYDAMTAIGASDITPALMEDLRTRLRDGTDSLVRQLRERVLTPQNVERVTPTSITYRLGPDALCEGDDVECAEHVVRLEPRLVLTSRSEGDIDMTLLLGVERRAPLALELHAGRSSARLDLDEGFALLGSALPDELERVRSASGRLELELAEDVPGFYRATLDVPEPLTVDVQVDEHTVTASLAPSPAALELRVQPSETCSVAAKLAALRLVGPLGAFARAFEEPDGRAYTGVVDLQLAGLTGAVHYIPLRVIFEDFGFGATTSTLKHDDRTLLTLDMKTGYDLPGVAVDVMRFDQFEGLWFLVRMGVDLRLGLAFEPIADQVESIAGYLLNDTLHVRFDGNNPTLVTNDGEWRVDSGLLQLSSASDPSLDLDAGPGVCIAAPPAPEAPDTPAASAVHPWSGLLATACE
jgi:hypothetical protein